ncbi:MAG: NAD(+) diphosphatase [Burkholderiales bacterium]|nr:NAD(+) diphosphatase [Burkholderiales bacterium]
MADDAYAFAFRGDQVLVRTPDAQALVLPRRGELDAVGVTGNLHFLGSLGSCACVALDLRDDAPEPAGMRFVGLRALFFKVPEELLALAARAFQIVDFDRNHRYCGRCGTPVHPRGHERAKECPACGLVAYPRISPAMMVLVTRGRELLLARAHRFAPGMFSALAGFVEPGETIEDCVRREVHEEVGLDVTDITYFASQSWAFPHSLMIAFTATYAGGDIHLEDEEIAEARWFPVDALPKLPMSVSIARRLIDATATRLRSA